MRLKERLSIIWRDIRCYLTSVSKQGNQMLAIIPYKRRLIQIEERDPFVVFILGFCSVAWRFKLFTVDSFANRSTEKLAALVFFLFSFVCVFVFPTKLRAFVKSERHLDLCFNVFFFFRDKVVSTLSTIHGHVLRECHQIPWAGEDHKITPRAQSPPEDGDATEPRSLSILLEKINLKHQRKSDFNGTEDVYVGPTTYVQFMHCFRHIFRDKRKESNERVERLT